MNHSNIIAVAQIVVAVIIVIAVLLQNRGAGMGAVFGGEGGVYKTKRGSEKFLYWATIVLLVVFFALALSQFII